MQNNASPQLGQLGRHLSEIRQRSSRRRTMRRLVLWCFAGTLMLLVVLLQGCGTTSTLQVEPQLLPLMPALSQPLPTVDYSLQAQRNIEAWQKSVRGMFKIYEPL